MEQLKKIIADMSPKTRKWVMIVGGVLILFMLEKCSCSSDNEEKAPVVSTAPTNYIDAVSVNDYKTAHEILDKLLAIAIQRNADNRWDSDEALEEFWAAADHIYKAEMMYLIDMKDIEANKRLINSLAMMNIIGDKPLHKTSAYSSITKYDNYQIFVTRFNRMCDEILNISLLNNNKDMARQILNLYKEDCSPHYKKDGDEDYYYYDFSTTSKDAALKKYNEAIKNGLLD